MGREQWALVVWRCCGLLDEAEERVQFWQADFQGSLHVIKTKVKVKRDYIIGTSTTTGPFMFPDSVSFSHGVSFSSQNRPPAPSRGKPCRHVKSGAKSSRPAMACLARELEGPNSTIAHVLRYSKQIRPSDVLSSRHHQPQSFRFSPQICSKHP